jgi:S1-C subfamily serine protease
MKLSYLRAATGLLAVAIALHTASAWAQPSPLIAEAEAKRLKAIEKVRGAVVAVFSRGGQGGGSGVLISADGYALTNFHVVQPTGTFMQCGLADGVLYDAVLCGLDPVGDVALIKLLPKEEKKPFPFAVMGDSEKVKVGDWALAMGNPFLLATDFTPTITYGLVSGTHRYQYPSGTILEYTDCIQIETSINPGNSGGPLFNLDGELIGINGRGSFEKRGRVNSGVGYAISINQIKNFLGHLRGGRQVDHATLGALVRTDNEGRLVVSQLLESSDAHRRGLDVDDELVYFAGRQMRSVNQYKNVLGIYPKGWRLPLVYRRTDDDKNTSTTKEVLVRLMGAGGDIQREERRPGQPRPGQPPRNPGDPPPIPGQPRDPKDPPRIPIPRPGQPMPEDPDEEKPAKDNPAAKFFEKKDGFVNYYFNKLERDRLVASAKKLGDFAPFSGAWTVEGERTRPVKNALKAEIGDKAVKVTIGEQDYSVEPLKPGESLANLREPRDSGGWMAALYLWRRFLQMGEKGFEQGFSYGGYEPYYPDGTTASRVEAEVLLTEHGPFHAKWFFSRSDGTLLGVEAFTEKDEDPCEVTFADYKEVDGRKLPHRMEVRFAGKEFGIITLSSYRFTPAADAKENKP